MKRLIYQVYVGKQKHLYNHCVGSVKRYCSEYGIDHLVQRTPILRIKPDVFATNRNPRAWEQHGGFLPIFEKENAFTYFEKYDQIAIIDADVWIRPDSPNIFDQLDADTDFAGVVENSAPISANHMQKINEYSRMQYGSLPLKWEYDKVKGYPYINMGIMLMNKSFNKYLNGQTPKQFIQRNEFRHFVDGVGPWKWSTDQTLLNYWIQKEEMNVKHLDWKWNALFSTMRTEHIREAYFVHFFKQQALPANGENIEQLMKLVE